MAIENNMVVSLEYELRDKATSDIIDSNIGEAPLEFITGRSHIIPGLESEILKMSEGDASQVIVAPAHAYGEFDETAVQQVPIEQFAGIDLQEGMTLYGQGEDGGTVQVIVKEIKDDSVVVDFNHPMAGKDLMFSVTISNVRDASADEIASGVPAENKVADSGCCSSGSGHSCGCH